MRAAFLLLVISFVACLYLAQAATPVEEEHAPAADREAALLDVDAGAGHENEAPREARGYYGRRYGGYGGYGHRGFGRRYGYGRGRYYG
ncbi:uncharacterized protein LOC114804988 [Zeugodacus cucurbitae]|uniref:uncharacterized protein LOC114804988 n=1 Tax=Zeugodacus cucurbitae TaxID=28588 RepID=UPI0010A74E03|nr:uncharacterized protein LOC114804988 [Zeugodacus cucurbitae]